MMTWHRLVSFSKIDDYLRLGWILRDSLRGTPHGDWAVHLEWICDCPMPLPASERHG
jgi:hypothetical protein